MASETRAKTATPRSLDDAIARVRAASAAAERARAGRAQRRIFTTDLHIPDHPDARRVQRGSIAAVVIGTLAIIFLPDTLLFHSVAFAAMFSLIFIGVPNIVLRANGALSWTKLVGWMAILLFIGAMTTIATGTSGNLWSWAPWMKQFYPKSY